MIEQAIANLTESINKQTVVLEKIVELVGVEVEQAIKNTTQSVTPDPAIKNMPQAITPDPVPAQPKKPRVSGKKELSQTVVSAPAPVSEPEPEQESEMDELFGLSGVEEEIENAFDVFEDAKKQTNALDMFKIACNVLNGPKKLQNVLSVRTKKILADLGINHITLSALDAKTVQAFRAPFFAACEELYAQGI